MSRAGDSSRSQLVVTPASGSAGSCQQRTDSVPSAAHSSSDSAAGAAAAGGCSELLPRLGERSPLFDERLRRNDGNERTRGSSVSEERHIVGEPGSAGGRGATSPLACGLAGKQQPNRLYLVSSPMGGSTSDSRFAGGGGSGVGTCCAAHAHDGAVCRHEAGLR
eukprot:1733828-Prymnesium_polylepis.1